MQLIIHWPCSAKPWRGVVGVGGSLPSLSFTSLHAPCPSIANESRRQRDPDGDDERVPFSAPAMSDRLHFKRQSGESANTRLAQGYHDSYFLKECHDIR